MSKDESQRFAGALRDASNKCEAALAVDMADHHSHCIMGMIQRSQGNAMGAYASFKDALEIEPSHASSNFYMALVGVERASGGRERGASPSSTRERDVPSLCLDPGVDRDEERRPRVRDARLPAGDPKRPQARRGVAHANWLRAVQ